MVTGVLLAVARIAGETAPLLFTALSNQFFTTSHERADGQPAGDDLQVRDEPVRKLAALAWAGVFLITSGRAGVEHPGARAVPQQAMNTAVATALNKTDDTIRPMQPWTRAPASNCPRTGKPPALLPARDREVVGARPELSIYGSFHALKHINLDIPERKVTAFIGPSGCGKSTLLRTFNRMFELYPEQRAEGSIRIDGEDILHSQASTCR